MASREDLAWAGGLFEGEGCITFAKFKPRSATEKRRQSGRLALVMTDKDVVDKFYSIIGIGTVYDKPTKNPKHKNQYGWRVQKFEHVQAVIAMLWPYLGERRKGRAKEVLHGIARPFGAPYHLGGWTP